MQSLGTLPGGSFSIGDSGFLYNSGTSTLLTDDNRPPVDPSTVMPKEMPR